MVASASFRDAIHGLNGGHSSPRPACGERSRASCERVRGTLDRLGLADSPSHPETLLRAVSDLSPQAARGEAAASRPCGCCLLLSSPAKAGDPVRRGFRFHHHFLWNTGSSAFADDDGGDDSALTTHHTHLVILAA